jgi:hypothetical protein
MANQTLSSNYRASKVQSRAWILCSSGARPLYIENVVRSLALTGESKIQFRYSERNVSVNFKTAFANGSLKDNTAYLSYLDNRDRKKSPKIYPVRQAKITAVRLRGTSYIVELLILGFFNWSNVGDFTDLIRDAAKESIAGLPVAEMGDDPETMVGECLLFDDAKFVPFDASKDSKHLPAFEATVRALHSGKDFAKGGYMFANMLGFRKASESDFVADGIVSAGERYVLSIYHYLEPGKSHEIWKPFHLKFSAQTEDVKILGNSEFLVAAEYDEVHVDFAIPSEAVSPETGIGFSVVAGEGENQVSVLSLTQQFRIKQDFWQLLFKVLGVFIGLAGSQMFVLSKLHILDWQTGFIISLIALVGTVSTLSSRIWAYFKSLQGPWI